MPDYIFYDPASTPIANKVVAYRKSMQESDAAAFGKPGVDVTGQTMPADLFTLRKVVAGVLTAFDQTDIDAVAAANAAAAAQAAIDYLVEIKAEAKANLASQAQLRDAILAVADVITPEINLLREQVVGVQTLVWDVANLANATGATSSNITVNGADFGDVVEVSCSISLAGLTATAYVSAANTVVIRLHNGTGGAVNLASATFGVCVLRRTNMPARTAPQVFNALKNAYDARVDSWT